MWSTGASGARDRGGDGGRAECAPEIELERVSFAYAGRHPVLEDVTLAVEPLSFASVIGPNGGGKTTLLKLMLGLLDPNRGTVQVFGQPPRKASHRIGYVPQNVHVNKTFPVSVLDVVLMGRLRSGKGWSSSSGRDRSAARAVMERLGVWPHRSRRIGELSGGELQRVCIARALVSVPEVLFGRRRKSP